MGPDDHVALEATANALAIARLVDGHVARVVVANTKKLRQISEAKTKTDRLDARTLARVLASGFLEAVWMPDEATRALRRWIARRAQLVRQRTRAKHEIHAVLVRTLTGPGVSDLFGKAGRAWLARVELPVDECVTIEGCLRQIAFLGAEIAIVERAIAEGALVSPEIRRKRARLVARSPRWLTVQAAWVCGSPRASSQVWATSAGVLQSRLEWGRW